MNAIISLCHFCELHGPRVLFCTQPVHPSDPKQNEVIETEQLSDAGFSDQPSQPTNESSASADSEEHAHSLPIHKADICEGCYSVVPGFVSHDGDAQVSYVSTQYPHQREVYSMVRQACIRSLSCEVCPGREGPIFFGDEQQGHVLSYTFYIKDSHARGYQRWYSILIFMMDKIYLLNSWPFLVPHLKTVIEKLQTKAKKVYEEEQIKCPQRAYRLTSSVSPANFRQQRGGNKPARSLIELTDDKNVFKLLHVAFIWILKMCGSRITETLLEGPPTEDSIIDMEKQEETEEGFIKIFTKKIGDEDEDSCPAPSTPVDPDGGHLPDLSKPSIQNIRHLMQVLGFLNFHSIAHHTIIGNQIIIRGTERQMVGSTLTALKSLLPRGCCRLIPFSDCYEESWRCNFLGLKPDVDLPNYVASSEIFVFIDIISPTNEDEYSSLSERVLHGYQFKISSPVTLPEKVPTVLNKMELALRSSHLSDQVVDQCWICMKEEWMNKVKVLFKFTKAGGSRSEEDTKKLLRVVGALDEDKQLLKFWMTGLSVQYRTHVLSASMSQQT